MLTRKKIAIAAPRGHGKSVWFSLVYVLWCLLYNKKKFILVISDSGSQAQSLLGAIVEELETNERIIKDFGKIAGYIPPAAEEKRQWTTRDIVTLTAVKVSARSWNSRIRGIRHRDARPDLIIMDDVENDENVQSEEQRIKVKNMLKKSILNLGTIRTQVIIIGTILHFDSMLMNLIEKPLPGWYTKLYRAIQDNKPLWPEGWTIDDLMSKKAEIGALPFEQEYMNNPLDPSQQILRPTKFYEGDIDLSMVSCYAYVDLAISEKETADYTAITTIAKHKVTGEMFVVAPQRIKAGVLKQLDMLFDYFKRFKHVAIGVESVAYQKAFYQLALSESKARKIYLPVVEVEIDKDKVRRALDVSPLIENGSIQFNESYVDFMSEVRQFPKSSHDDFVDSLVGAIKLATKHSGSNSATLTTKGINSFYGKK